MVTVGAPNLDYKLATGSTCTGLVTQGATCTVRVTLAPRYSGERKGAVEVVDGSGNVLATTLIYAIGVAPQIAFDPAVQTTIGTAPFGSEYNSLAIDESGYLYLDDNIDPFITKLPSDGGTPTTVDTGLMSPSGVALDGAGNIFLLDSGVVKLSPDGSKQIMLPFTGVELPQDVAVDGAGNVFLSYYNFVGNGSVGGVAELPASGNQITLPFAGLDIPYSLAVDNVGDVFVSDYHVTGPENPQIFELPPSGSGQVTLPFTPAGLGQLATDAAKDLFAGEFPQIVQIPAGANAPIAISHFPNTAGSERQQNVAVSSAGDVFSVLPNNNLVELHRSQPPPLSFPETALGTTSIPQSIQIQNIGNAALSFSGVSASGPFAVVPGSGTPANCTVGSSLAPGALCDLSIVFTPESASLITGTVTLSDNSLNNNLGSHIIQLSGIIGDAAEAKLSVATMQFGHIAYPAGSTLPLTITNIGGSTLTITPSINGPSYKITSNTCGAGVDAGKSCTLQVQYAPVSIGSHNDILTLVTNGSANNGPPTIAVPLKALAIGVGALETQTTLQFGTIDTTCCSTDPDSAVLGLTIHNYGIPGNVTITTKINGPSYTIIGSTCTGVLAAGTSCTLIVQFETGVPGYHNDILTITPSGGAALPL